MKAKLKGKKLIIELPLQAPKRSASGKTMVVATSHGVRRSRVKVDGETVCLSVSPFATQAGRKMLTRKRASHATATGSVNSRVQI